MSDARGGAAGLTGGSKCRTLLISAPASNQGKTTITAGLARYHADRGLKVHVFKTGPDFLDPMILERASGNPVQHLDLWMSGQQRCQRLLFEAASQADLILIEGVMGLFDGLPSSADLAEMFSIPILLVINASAMAQTFHAIAHGLASYRENLTVLGAVANRVASPRHAEMLSKTSEGNVRLLGCINRSQSMTLPDRHLGLVQAEEISDLDERLNTVAAAIANTALTELPDYVHFQSIESEPLEPLLDGRSIAIAQDQAFSFTYDCNIELLTSMGARIKYFSPLNGDSVPEADAVYLPGGYPELHLEALSRNTRFHTGMKEHHASGRPIYAECRGMLCALETLTNTDGKTANMLGLMPGSAVLQNRLMGLGYQEIATASGAIRGHTFHHSQISTPLAPQAYASRPPDGARGEAVYRQGSLRASYVHLYFPSNPKAAAQLFLTP